MIQFFTWWLIVQVIGWSALPIAFRLFRWLPDRGYAFAKALGLLLASYLLWMGAMTGFVRNDAAGILAALLIVIAISAWLVVTGREPDRSLSRSALARFLKEHFGFILTGEILFLLAFAAWALMRAYATFKIQPAGGEKFMEFAFLNAILNSKQLPPLDPWLSGFGISYYYFGYMMMALLTRLSGVLPGIGFDLYDALLFALTALGVYGVVYDLIAGRLSRRPPGSSPVAFGVIGALIVTLMGNLEGLLEVIHTRGLLPLSFWQWLNIPNLADAPVSGGWMPGSGGDWLWWWRASRILFDDPVNQNPLNSITEFPGFSFILGDNHPHVLALPFILLAVALGLNLLRWGQSMSREEWADRQAQPWWNPVAGVFKGQWFTFIMYALGLGALGFLNTWDMPIYIGVVTLAYAVGVYARQRKLDLELIYRTVTLGAGLLMGAILFYLLFYLGFSSQAGGILPYVLPPTRLPQYLVMFGVFIFILIWLLLALLVQQAKADQNPIRLGELLSAWGWVVLACIGLFALVLALVFITAAGRDLIQRALSNPNVQSALGSLTISEGVLSILAARLADPWLFLLLTFLLSLPIAILRRMRSTEGILAFEENAQISAASPSELYILVLIFVGLALTFSVEFFYLRDSFMMRMNTVFKFYYQGWMMLGIASAYGLWWLMDKGKSMLGIVGRSLFGVGAVILILAGMVYPVLAYDSRAADFASQPDLNAASEVAKDNPDDWAAIQWLRQNAVAQADLPYGQVPVILEAPGTNYTYNGRISAFSGFPAVLGWAYHEAQWRGSYTEQGLREPDIVTIYTTKDGKAALDLLHKWNVTYVILGATEQSYIQEKCSDPSRVCNLSTALRKFDAVLKPVFQHGNMTIYAVPNP